MQNALFSLCCGAVLLLTAYVLYRSVFSIRTDFGFLLDVGRANTQTCLAAFAVLLGAFTYVFLLVSLYRFLQRCNVAGHVLLACDIGVFALFCVAYFVVAQNFLLLPHCDLSYLVSEAEFLMRDGVLRSEAREYFSIYPLTYFSMPVLSRVLDSTVSVARPDGAVRRHSVAQLAAFTDFFHTRRTAFCNGQITAGALQ